MKKKEAACFAQALTNTMPWRCIWHKGFTLWMLHGSKVAQPSPALLPLTQLHISKSLFCDVLRQGNNHDSTAIWEILSHFRAGSVQRGARGDYHRWGESIDWRAASRSTVNSFRQNIKVLQQLLRVQGLKREQRQTHRELLLLPGKWILPRVPGVNNAFSLRSSQGDSNDLSLHGKIPHFHWMEGYIFTLPAANVSE